MKDKKNIIISYILSKSLFFGLGISYILDNANQNSGLAIIIGYLIGGIILYFINKKDIYNFTNSFLGKLLMFILIIVIMNTILLSFTVETINFYLPQTPALIISISFLLITLYGANKNFDSFKRLNELLLYISLILTFVGIVGNFGNIDFNNYQPLFYHLDFCFIKTIIIVIILSITPLIVLLNNTKISNKELLLGYFLSGINILLFVSSTIGTLGLTLAKSYRYPEYIAFEKINFLNFIERIENFLAFIWLIDLISFGILCVISIFKFIKKKYVYLIFFLITYLTVKYFINIYQNTMFIYHYIFYILIFIISLVIMFSKKKI